MWCMEVRRRCELYFFFEKNAIPFNPFGGGSCNNSV